MSGPHLGARVTPLVDGRLAADAQARAAEHLRGCLECTDAVESERLVRARLQALGAPEVSEDLMARLLDIGGPHGPLPPRDRPIANPARPVVGLAPPSRTDPVRARGGRGPSGRAARRVRRRPVAAALAGTFSLLGAGIVGVLVLGGVPGGDAPAPVAELRTTPSASPTSTTVSRGLPPASPSATAPTSASPGSALPTP
ncbi:anti-sigma factor [Kineococcus sp. SYSU DK003]|uniref:hypothetical protein n=1 Tax=Kineococcus sp. SYSU DK003 TaxID=3383124 RepID=UPI003D7D74AE